MPKNFTEMSPNGHASHNGSAKKLSTTHIVVHGERPVNTTLPRQLPALSSAPSEPVSTPQRLEEFDPHVTFPPLCTGARRNAQAFEPEELQAKKAHLVICVPPGLIGGRSAGDCIPMGDNNPPLKFSDFVE